MWEKSTLIYSGLLSKRLPFLRHFPGSLPRHPLQSSPVVFLSTLCSLSSLLRFRTLRRPAVPPSRRLAVSPSRRPAVSPCRRLAVSPSRLPAVALSREGDALKKQSRCRSVLPPPAFRYTFAT